ncbi:hypothetical protein Poli38472_002232 [Pythium oligandrum]|uniref:G-patch domain-containing protein n=1 Tax=Pythium oligandrum TaxID=41045 RepID=A0A8K1CGV0_PYTOL|nr:hypothetical protein Poli38472_002232 [Pythium oligandrum]|eukprot:TMW63291.1 hypothetical protein Poli38472_002232 [Pythium oligandrum]
MAQSGLSNADFARLFRKEAQAPSEDQQARGDGGDAPVNTMLQAAMRRNEQEQWDDGAPPPRAGLGSFTRSQGPDESVNGNDDATTAEEKKRALSEAEMKRQFTWQKHTKGFGMKMMAKMGFTGRLGKDEKGVSTTLEVVQRPAQMGLGFGDFKEASTLKQNKRVEKELKGETYDEKEEQLARKRERELLHEDDSLWRKRKTPVGGRKYKKASEISEEAHQKKSRNEVILDMRGPDVRVLDKLTDAYVDQERLAEAAPKLGEELIYNVRMVVNLAQGRIYDLTQKIDANTSTLHSMRQEAKILKSQVDMDAMRWKNVKNMLTDMEKLESLSLQAVQTQNLEDVLIELRSIRTTYPREFEAYKLHQAVPSLVIPTLEALLSSTGMLEHTSAQVVAGQFRHVQLFLLEVPATSSHIGDEGGIGIFHHIREKHDFLGDEIYNHILEETMWPAVVQMVNAQWNVKSDPTACPSWFQLFRPHLTQEFADAFLHQLVLPRLKKECQRWTPQDTTLIHEWLSPWTASLDNALEALYPDIQLVLGNALNQWHPSDESVLPVISPWRALWGEAEFAKFTHRHIIRKLARCLQREFEVNPQDQQLQALRWVFAWQDYLPERQLVALFEGEFFPKWLRVLRRWVSSSASLPELEKWYVGWKRFFEKHNLATHPRIVIQFHGALVLLEAACSKDEDENADIPDLNPRAASSYQDALLKSKEAENEYSPNNTPSRSAKPTRTRPSHSIGIKEMIENLAISKNIMFMPKGFHDGQQVYLFGKHHILIEQGVVFVEKAKGQFKPVDIEELIE